MRESPTVHQFISAYAERDAVSQHTFAVDSLLREMGCATVLFAEQAYRTSKIRVVNFRKHHKYPRPDAILYQFANGSPVGEYLARCSEPLILNYHNITPSEYYRPWAPHIGDLLTQARRQLELLAANACAGIADSAYNARDLTDLGMSDVAVVPIILESKNDVPKSTPMTSDAPLLLFVGQLVPNKRIERLISAFAVLQHKWNAARLVIVGSSKVVEYERALRRLIDRLNLNGSIEFTGSISGAMRDTYYSTASVYVSASSHEGFCVPLVEAMNAGLPLVVHDSTAVPETVGSAALLLDCSDPLSFAQGIDMVLTNAELRDEMIRRGLERGSRFAPLRVRQEMRSILESLFENL